MQSNSRCPYRLALTGILLWTTLAAPISLALTAADTPPAVAPAKPATPTPAETAFGQKIEATLNAGDGDFFHDHYAYALMAQRVAGDAKLSAEQMKALAAALQKNMNLGATYASLARGGTGAYKFKGVRDVKGERRLCFRLSYGTGPNAGINLMEFLLVKAADGSLTIGDAYSVATGQWWCEKARTNYLTTVLEDEPDLLKLLRTGAEAEYEKHRDRVDEYYAKVDDRDWDAALEAFDALPAALQKDRNMLLNRIQVASHLGEKKYKEIFDASSAPFKDDPLTLEFVQGDWYIASRQFDKLLAFFDLIESVYGVDAHYEEQRCQVYQALKKPEEAKKAARTGLAVEPKFVRLYMRLVEISLTEKNYDDTLAVLTAYEKSTGDKVDDLTQLDFYKDFVASPQFKRWQAQHKTAAPDEKTPPAPAEQ